MSGSVMAVVCIMQLVKHGQVICSHPFPIKIAEEMVVIDNADPPMEGWSQAMLFRVGEQPKGAVVPSVTPHGGSPLSDEPIDISPGAQP